jgi:hypothetical protein
MQQRANGLADTKHILPQKQTVVSTDVDHYLAQQHARSSDPLTPQAALLAEAAQLRSILRETCEELERQYVKIVALQTKLLSEANQSPAATNTPIATEPSMSLPKD